MVVEASLKFCKRSDDAFYQVKIFSIIRCQVIFFTFLADVRLSVVDTAVAKVCVRSGTKAIKLDFAVRALLTDGSKSHGSGCGTAEWLL